LSKKYCPDVTLGYFNYINNLKNNSSFADFLGKTISDIATFEEWLSSVITVLKRSD
jgi:hypothetical protein